MNIVETRLQNALDAGLTYVVLEVKQNSQGGQKVAALSAMVELNHWRVQSVWNNGMGCTEMLVRYDATWMV